MATKIPLVGASALALAGSACGGDGGPSAAEVARSHCEYHNECGDFAPTAVEECVTDFEAFLESRGVNYGSDCLHTAIAYYDCQITAVRDHSTCDAPSPGNECLEEYDLYYSACNVP